jgi:ABC-type sugar transport system substrate-binding protein
VLSRFLIVAGVAAVAAAAAVSSSAAPVGQRAGVVTIGYADPLASEEGLRGVGWGEKQAIKNLGLAWKVAEIDDKLSADKQVSDIDSMIAQHVGGVTSWTLDPGAADAVYKRARAAGIPVIGLNSTSKYFNSSIQGWTDATCLVSQQQAQFIAQKIPGAKIFALGGPPVPSITLTTNCFLAAAKKAGLDVIAFQKSQQGSQTEGQQITQSLLLQHPDVQAIWSFTEGLSLGVSAAVKGAGKPIWSGDKKGIIVIARNGTSAAAEAIRTGNMTATWDNNQPLVGAAAIQLLKYLLVDKVAAAELPTKIYIPSKRWEPSNIASYKSPVSRPVPLPLPVKFTGLKVWCAKQTVACTWR